MPVATVTVHSDPVPSVAVPAVSVSVAVAVPDLEAAAVNVVLPHPFDVLSPPGVLGCVVARTVGFATA